MKKNSIALLAIIILIPGLTFAQSPVLSKSVKMLEDVKSDSNKNWRTGGLVDVSFTQANFTNWDEGGTNSVGVTALTALHAHYRSGKFTWLNDAQLGYGIEKLDALPAQKNADQIDLTSSVGYALYKYIAVSFLTNFQSQFQPGYSNAGDSVLLSSFLAPAYWVLAAGFQYTPKIKGFTVFLSPLTARLTFVENQALSDQGAYGVTPGKTELTQVGAYINMNYSNEIMKNVTVTTKLELFSDYLKNPQNIVVDWTTLILLKVNKFISLTANTDLKYDNNVLLPIYKIENGENTLVGKGPRLQFKDICGVGIAINLK